jgi:hypothetical protein
MLPVTGGTLMGRILTTLLAFGKAPCVPFRPPLKLRHGPGLTRPSLFFATLTAVEGFGMSIRRDSRAIARGANPGAALILGTLLLTCP